MIFNIELEVQQTKLTQNRFSRKHSRLALEGDLRLVVETGVLVTDGAVDITDLDVAFRVERRRCHCHTVALLALEKDHFLLFYIFQRNLKMFIFFIILHWSKIHRIQLLDQKSSMFTIFQQSVCSKFALKTRAPNSGYHHPVKAPLIQGVSLFR